jgi:hypothetical protein
MAQQIPITKEKRIPKKATLTVRTAASTYHGKYFTMNSKFNCMSQLYTETGIVDSGLFSILHLTV